MIFKTGISGILNVGDSLFPFFPQERFLRFFYLWDSHVTLGRDNSIYVTQMPWYGLLALLDKLSFPLVFINRLWFALPFFLLGASMYFLSGVIFGKEKKTPRFIATLFSLFNPFTLNLLSGGSIILMLSFSAGVFVFGLFVCGLNKSRSGLKEAFLIGLISSLISANLVVWLAVALLCAAYLLFFVTFSRNNRFRLRHAVKFLLTTILYSLITNLWWLILSFGQLANPAHFSSFFSAGTDVGTLEFISQHVSLFNVSRLFYGYTPAHFFPISNYYHYLLSPTIMSVLVVLVFAVSLFKKKSKFEVFFLLMAFFSVILASGTRPPFGFVYKFLWDHIPYFHIFRTTNRFNLYTMVSYAILLGFLYQRLTRLRTSGILSTPKFYKFFIISFLFISIFLSSWPLLSGDIYGQLKPHQIPKDYYDLREFLQNQEGDFRVMSLPKTDWLVTYAWSVPFDMQEILTDFSPKDTVINPVGHFQDLEERRLLGSDPIYAAVYYLLERFSNSCVLNADRALDNLRLMGVKYLVLHRDYVNIYKKYPAVYTKPLENTLQTMLGIDFLKSFGDLDVYEVENFRPRIYVTAGEVAHEKINPTQYKISVEDAKSPYKLVFSESFDPGWRLASRKPEGSLIRGFGNVWQIDKTGDYTSTLTYWPQRLLEISLAISALGLVGGLGVLIFKKR